MTTPTNTDPDHNTCDCHEVHGERCIWREAPTCTVYYMPLYLRASHMAVGGTPLPRRGARVDPAGWLHLRVTAECAACLDEGDWLIVDGRNG